ncbi:hypothetical protein PTTG_01080 [Puccinia triticina 1-1 BBBD Race 1]|uniref:Uncharacterized protein n=2 Tax=Puccinia triticina TaxID=208348 RepID=A0A180GYF7_PUCT1|nr:uncharacterized protein PtA15_10A659 [Puccinia triticina]OAV97770.1 hypothetical protein PTTG_01080 [Puccinia triticina 1-1 BBBD Race 1]WAQ89235.1 hypothetical protein PtA15_10A659 [Puccinia triticina]WAR59287.1 hypothetical protein PtB15_10B629 [Puccinia triticina]
MAAPARPADETLPPGSLRPYDHARDNKYLNFLVGSAILSRTAPANQALFWSNPLVYLWTILFTLYFALNRLLLRPDTSSSGLSAIIISFPFLFAPPLILLVLLNRANRSHFHSLLVQTLSRRDLRDPSAYYHGSDPGDSAPDHQELHSEIWVLDYDGRQLGIVALDVDLEGYEELGSPSVGHQTVLVRHLASAPDFRPAGIDVDLLEHVRRRVFTTYPSFARIAIPILSPIDPFLKSALNQLGFRPLPTSQSQTSSNSLKSLLGLLGWPDCPSRWPQQIWILERESSQSESHDE